MLRVLTILVTIFIANNAVNSADCRTVKQGSHYPAGIPFHGFRSNTVITSRVQFTNSSSTYSFPPTDPQALRCTSSWNKLYGACRCGMFANNHKDSDRFVFRRAMNCAIDEFGALKTDTKACPESDLIEIAAYAYDNGDVPFENIGRLLKEFSTKLRINVWYKITLTFEENKTTYQLFDSNDQPLETQEIDHRVCSGFKDGMMQDLYFGGVCPAPQDVSVCYDQA